MESISSFKFVLFGLPVIACLFWYYRLRIWLSKLPPLNPASMLETLRIMTGAFSPDYSLKCAREIGGVMRYNLPGFAPIISISDPKFLRLVLEGDEKIGLRGGEKPEIYDNMNGPRPSGLFTMKTYGTRWEIHRKALAPSFSNVNLYKILPKLSICLKHLDEFFESKIQKNESFDVRKVMLCLVLDALTISMFDTNFQALKEGSTGQMIIEEENIALTEFVGKQKFNPFRRYMFWSKEVKRAIRASAFMVS
jgi:cytochrome P450